MITSSAQLKGKLRNVANANNADARILMRMYMTERLLERIASSEYKNKFILKGGTLIASMVGVGERSTMDLDTTIRGKNVSINEIRAIMEILIRVDVGDGVTFQIKDVSEIMEGAEYSGIRVSMEALFDGTRTPIKVDVSTGDIITPGAQEYDYKCMLEDRAIRLWAYPIETILAEKMESILAKDVLNTRMRDYYDLYEFYKLYETTIDYGVLAEAVRATSDKRETTELFEDALVRLTTLGADSTLQRLWNGYRQKYSYAEQLEWEQIMQSVKTLFERVGY